MKNYIRYGVHKKKNLLKDASRAFDGLAVPANILLYQYKATPGAILYINKPFFVDPMSYLFGENYEVFKKRADEKTKVVKFKPSFEKLLIGHGFDPEVFLQLNYKEIRKELVSSKKRLEQFVDACLNFQHKMVEESLKEDEDIAKEFLTESSIVNPQFLIPPYFKFDVDEFEETYKLTNKILDYAFTVKIDNVLQPLVYVSKKVLKNKVLLTRVVNLMQNYKGAGFVIWVDDFNEYTDADENLVDNLISLVKDLSKNDKSVTFLHAGYFSMLMKYFGAAAICHGPGYGESKSGAASAKGGGPPLVRYYLKEPHTFLTLERAVPLVREYPDFICRCQICKDMVGDDPERIANFKDSEELADLHYLYVRYFEKQDIIKNDLAWAIQDLGITLDLYDKLDEVTRSVTDKNGNTYDEQVVRSDHLKVWKTSLEKNIKKPNT